jgi:hypothetical protein
MSYYLDLISGVEINREICKTMIETGSHRGFGAAAWASFFENVISIELSEELHDYCKKTHILPNLTFLQGTSTSLLENLVSDINHDYVLFLDAHGSGGDTVFDPVVGRYGAPVLQEIDCVKKNPPKHILIDDYSDFVEISSYPKLEQIYQKVLSIGNYTPPHIHKTNSSPKGVICFRKLN